MDGSALLWPDGLFTGHAPGERRQAHADHRWAYRRVSDAALAGALPVELLDALLQVGVYRKPPIPH
jgi:hypothetical protein